MTPSAGRDFAAYLAAGDLTDPWQVSVTGIGHTRVRPGVAYPPGDHPADHALSWSRGRVLHEFQVVYVSEGRGRFESASGERRKIESGTAFLLFPGEWHRYEPVRSVGWVEDWVELGGPAVGRLAARGVISPDRPLHRIGIRPDVLALFEEGRQLARAARVGFQPVLAVLGLQILTRVLFASESRDAAPSDVDVAIRRAQAMIAAATDEPPRMDEVAAEVGMSYSYFRRAFRARAGLSPKQYHVHLRLRRAQDLLTNSDATVTDIAERLGFDSPFHLSAEFKRRTGLSPTQWRDRVARRGAAAQGPRRRDDG